MKPQKRNICTWGAGRRPEEAGHAADKAQYLRRGRQGAALTCTWWQLNEISGCLFYKEANKKNKKYHPASSMAHLNIQATHLTFAPWFYYRLFLSGPLCKQHATVTDSVQVACLALSVTLESQTVRQPPQCCAWAVLPPSDATVQQVQTPLFMPSSYWNRGPWCWVLLCVVIDWWPQWRLAQRRGRK